MFFLPVKILILGFSAGKIAYYFPFQKMENMYIPRFFLLETEEKRKRDIIKTLVVSAPSPFPSNYCSRTSLMHQLRLFYRSRNSRMEKYFAILSESIQEV